MVVFASLPFSLGKNDGSVKGMRYFSCGAKRGVFVRPDKVLLDKRGRALRNNNPTNKQNHETTPANGMPRSASKGKNKTYKLRRLRRLDLREDSRLDLRGDLS